MTLSFPSSRSFLYSLINSSNFIISSPKLPIKNYAVSLRVFYSFSITEYNSSILCCNYKELHISNKCTAAEKEIENLLEALRMHPPSLFCTFYPCFR